MSELPSDLMPLPTRPYNERPESMPLDVEECRTALWMQRGNVSKAAEVLKIKPARLRKFIKNSPYLLSEMEEAREELKDIAEDNVYEALSSDDEGRKDSMTRFVLASIGRDRGYGTGNAGTVNLNLPKGNIKISWEDGTAIQDNSPIIEGTRADG